MHLPHFVEKSQQFLEDHRRESLIVVNCLYTILSLALITILGFMAYLTIVG